MKYMMVGDAMMIKHPSLRFVICLLLFFALFVMCPIATLAEETNAMTSELPSIDASSLEEDEASSDEQIITEQSNQLSIQFYSTSFESPFWHSEHQDDGAELTSLATRDAKDAYTVAEAGEGVRSSMKNRQRLIVVTLYDKEVPQDFASEANARLEAMLDVAYMHTGEGCEGDYIRYSIGRIDTGIEGQATGSEEYPFIYQFNLNVEYFTDENQEAIVDKYLRSCYEDLGMDNLDAYSRIATLYAYIKNNVSYDYIHLNDESYTLKHSAYAAIVDGQAVCQGYALLLYRMLLDNDVDCRIITGQGNSDAHVWNIVALGGLYYNVDVTWDSEVLHAGTTQNKYFLKSNDDFDGHIRDDSFLIESFMRQYPMSESSYKVKQTEENGFVYEISEDGGITIVEYKGSDKDVNVPARLGGLPVTHVGRLAFYKNQTIESVIIPSSVTSIEDGEIRGEDDESEGTYYTIYGAFAFCKNLKEVAFQDGSHLETIGEWAFYNCERLCKLELPVTIRTLRTSCLSGCASLTSLVLPEGLETIAQNALNRTGIKKLVIPSTCTYYYYYMDIDTLEEFVVADGNPVFKSSDGVMFGLSDDEWCIFYPPSKKDELYRIPDFIDEVDGIGFRDVNPFLKVIDIGMKRFIDNTFQCIDCSISISPDNPYYTLEDGILYDKDKETLLKIDHSVLGEVVVPDGVLTIGQWAADGCKFSSIILPESVDSIEFGAFQNNENLISATLPTNVSSFGASVFSECYSLTDVKLPRGVKAIEATFFSCYSLTKVIIPSSVERIDNMAFHYSAIADIYFLGCPEFGTTNSHYGLFGQRKISVYYPIDDERWDDAAKNSLQLSSPKTEFEFHAVERTGDHLWSEEYIVDRSATCTQEGSESIHCYLCGEQKAGSARPISKIDHVYGEWTVTKDAVCTEPGSRERVCVLCESCDTEEIHCLGHDWDEGVVTTPPGCEVEGVLTHTCRNDAAHTYTELVAPTGHDWDGGAVTAEPTCTEQGVRTYACSNDPSHARTEAMAALGHSYVESVVEATWDEGGYTLHRCARCGDERRTDEAEPLRAAAERAAAPVSEAIAALPDAAALTLADGPAVEAARAAYDALTDPQKTLVAGLDRLEAAEGKLAELSGPGSPFFLDADPGDAGNHGAEVEWMGRSGISAGWDVPGGKEFRGMASVKRCDFAAFLYRMADLSDDGERNDSNALPEGRVAEVLAGVSDCGGGTPHAAEVAWMVDSGISRGWPNRDGTVSFRPMANVARQDMAAFLYRFADLADDGTQDKSLTMGPETVTFSDVRHGDETNHAGEVEWLASVGVTKGWKVGGKYEFRGTKTVARQDMAAFMYRLHGYLD